MSNIFQQAGENQIRAPEWQGASSAKFTTNKRHNPAPQPDQNQPHPLFSAGARKHYAPQTSSESEWKPHIKVAHDKDRVRPDKVSSVKMIKKEIAENTKGRPERRHTDQGGQTFETYEDKPIGKTTFLGLDNRKTTKEVEVKFAMGAKKQVTTMFEARNGLAMTSLGDKNYKAPEYQPGFFRDGGLVAGST